MTFLYYFSSSKWKSPSSPFQTFTILKISAHSVGDVMRDLDKRGLMAGDFLFVSGDVVSNISLQPALAQHRARREKDKNAIMTMVLRQAGAQHRTKSTGRKPVFVIDPVVDRCVHYEEMGHRKHDRRIKLEPDLLTTHHQLEIRADLIDCYIDICTPDALSLWSDNFDYQSVRQSFLSEVLKDYELTGKTIHTYIATDQYAARVQSLRAYHAVSKDIIERWTYPLCPDSNLVRGQNYRSAKGKVYEEDGVRLARGSVVKSRSVLGQNTSLADGSVVSDSVLGRRCQIGKDVTIDNSYLWDDVVVGDGTVVKQAIIAEGVTIGKKCIIQPGALISFAVRIPDGTTVSGTSRIIRPEPKHRDNDEETNGRAGNGFEEYFTSRGSDDGDSDHSSATTTSSNLVYRSPSGSMSDSSISTLNFEGDDDDEYENFQTGSRRSSIISSSNLSGDVAPQNRDFHLEASASILDGLQKGDLSENILLELNSYRMAMDANQHDVRHAVVAAFMKRIWSLVTGGCADDDDPETETETKTKQQRRRPSPHSAHEAVKAVLSTYHALLEKTVFDQDHALKPDQIDLLILFQKELVGGGSPNADANANANANAESMLLFIVKELSDLGVVDEDGILQWWDHADSAEGALAGLRCLTEQFVVYLRDVEEEEEGDEEDEESDDEG